MVQNSRISWQKWSARFSKCINFQSAKVPSGLLAIRIWLVDELDLQGGYYLGLWQAYLQPGRKWGFPKIRGTILGVPLIRAIVYWGLYLGPPILGNYQTLNPKLCGHFFMSSLGYRENTARWCADACRSSVES